MKSPAETARAAFDKLKAVVLRARQRAGVTSAAKVLPYSQWRDLPRRKAAKMADTRQCKRRAEFRRAFAKISRMYGGEPRRNRRIMARAMAAISWRGTVAPATTA